MMFISMFRDEENRDPNNKLSVSCESIKRTADIFRKYQHHILIVRDSIECSNIFSVTSYDE